MASNRVEAEILQKKRFTKVLMSITFSTVFIAWPYFAGLIGTAVTRKTAHQISLERKSFCICGESAYINKLVSVSSGNWLSCLACITIGIRAELSGVLYQSITWLFNINIILLLSRIKNS
ncbi:hypothetical protein TrispH2_011910, partial [Trichoplax sp. H2]